MTTKRSLFLFLLVASAVIGFLWAFRESDPQDDSVEVSPIALYVLDQCIDAVLQNQQLNEAEVLRDLVSIVDGAKGLAGSSFTVEILDDFNCKVVVPHLSYDPRNLRLTLDLLKESDFDDRATYCRWSGGHRDGFAISTLGCVIRDFSEERVIRYNLDISMQAKGEAIFSLMGSSVDGTKRF